MGPPFPPAMDRTSPTPQTLREVERILRTFREPLRFNRIRNLLPRKVPYGTLREAIEHCKRLGCVTEGSKGILWTLSGEPGFTKVVEAWGAR